MHLARHQPRGDAFMILAVDDDVPAAVTDAIRTNEAVLDLWLVRLADADADDGGELARTGMRRAIPSTEAT